MESAGGSIRIFTEKTGGDRQWEYRDEKKTVNMTSFFSSRYLFFCGHWTGRRRTGTADHKTDRLRKVTDTWTKDYYDYISAATFSHNNGNIIQGGFMWGTGILPMLSERADSSGELSERFRDRSDAREIWEQISGSVIKVQPLALNGANANGRSIFSWQILNLRYNQ